MILRSHAEYVEHMEDLGPYNPETLPSVPCIVYTDWTLVADLWVANNLFITVEDIEMYSIQHPEGDDLLEIARQMHHVEGWEW